MADNYLEKRQEELAHAQKTVVRRNHLSLDTLLRRNRSYRGFSGTVSEAQLRELVGVVPLVASGMNRQALRFRLVCGASEASLVHPLVKLGAALPQEHLPHPGMEPGGIFILNFRREALKEALGLPLEPVAVIGLGKPAETVFLVPGASPDALAYYRKDGVHYVPKLSVDQLII